VRHSTDASRRSLSRYAWLSIGAAIVTIGLKGAAYLLTGSVGLLSDALESFVNLAGALMALAMLAVAARPADETHAFGHSKAEYFSSGVEGTLILIAAGSIGWTAVGRLLAPRPLEQAGLGLAVSFVASLVNLAVALVILRAARRHESITLEANAHHLLTDVWTSVGVIGGVGLVAVSGWQRLDPIVALLVAANIVYAGVKIVRSSIRGLMDATLPHDEVVSIERALAPFMTDGVGYHALRTRQAGARRFVSLHVLVPGAWTVQRGHDLLEAVEAALGRTLPGISVLSHLEPSEDPASWADSDLDRGDAGDVNGGRGTQDPRNST
jgi:cation diffusion facilitator family transporter